VRKHLPPDYDETMLLVLMYEVCKQNPNNCLTSTRCYWERAVYEGRDPWWRLSRPRRASCNRPSPTGGNKVGSRKKKQKTQKKEKKEKKE